MDGLKTITDAHRRLTNSADGVASVAAFLNSPADVPSTDRLNAVEYLKQAEALLRSISELPIFKGD